MRGSSGIRLSKAVIALTLALTVVSLLAACGSSTAKGSAAGATGASPDSAGCATDFEFVFDHADALAGHTRDVFLALNNGTSPCTIKGYPVVTLGDPSIKVTTTTSADTWSNIAIKPITIEPEDSATSNDFYYFALQGRDDTTNCKLVSPSIALAQGITGSPTSVITVCGGELFVSPVFSSSVPLT